MMYCSEHSKSRWVRNSQFHDGKLRPYGHLMTHDQGFRIFTGAYYKVRSCFSKFKKKKKSFSESYLLPNPRLHCDSLLPEVHMPSLICHTPRVLVDLRSWCRLPSFTNQSSRFRCGIYCLGNVPKSKKSIKHHTSF